MIVCVAWCSGMCTNQTKESRKTTWHGQQGSFPPHQLQWKWWCTGFTGSAFVPHGCFFFFSFQLFDFCRKRMIIRKQTKTTSMWWWAEKIFMVEEVGRCSQRAIHTKRWYAKPSIKIQNNWEPALLHTVRHPKPSVGLASIEWHWISFSLCATHKNEHDCH